MKTYKLTKSTIIDRLMSLLSHLLSGPIMMLIDEINRGKLSSTKYIPKLLNHLQETTIQCLACLSRSLFELFLSTSPDDYIKSLVI